MPERPRTLVRSLRHWFRRLTLLQQRLTQALAVVVCAALVFAGFQLWQSVKPNSYCANQGSTIVQHASGECVGISDGRFVFAPELADVEHRILAENQLVAAQHPGGYVSVVLLLPISDSSGSIEAMSNVLEQLRGAYITQYRANRTTVDGIVPAIQLLIGNDGYQANQWPTTTRIIKQTEQRTHVAAVAGLGVSLTTTIAATDYLTSQAGMPVFGATVTANDFDNIRKFVRVAPSNHDTIAVAVQYIGKQFKSALLVQDENTGDAYDGTLVTGFEQFADPAHALVGRETFDSTPRTAAATEAGRVQANLMIRNRISQMTSNICTAQPAAVLFAGRGEDLAELVADLADRPCLNTPITIISGDDVTNLPFTDAVRKGLSTNVTVDYAGIANPGEWTIPTQDPTTSAKGAQGFKAFNDYAQQLFPGAPLSDGNTMAAYDAMLTAVSAIRLTSLPQPTLDAVAGELGALHGSNEVLGASGPLDFYADYDTSKTGSDPDGKPIPILKLAPNGDAAVQSMEIPKSQVAP
ncbi:ABC-type branched-subunit amino acid transport system substrate-binding protein [Catenulispora sp. GP43]|uniref:ABC transporter substrate-binding protein n=1 Tax=Catenulispora sp. GP43 TaxID=3156263 RepID=UPI003515B40D